jgi:hypothetical protein
LPDFSWCKIPKLENIPKDQLNIPKKPDKIPNGNKIYQMAIKFTKIFYATAFKNIQKLWFLVWKYIYYLAILFAMRWKIEL